jgi:hypothetical protein
VSQTISRCGASLRSRQCEAIDQRIVVGLNEVAKSVVRDLGAEAAYAGRLVYADSYQTSVPQNCNGATPNVTVNGLVLSQAANGTDPKLLHRLISTATFHPTKDGQRVLGQAVQDAFHSMRLHYAGTGLSGSGTLGQPLRLSASVEGGQGPFTVTSSVDGQVPAWLELGLDERSVVISGTPSTAGSWSFPVSVTDAHGDSVSIPVRVTVASATPPLQIVSFGVHVDAAYLATTTLHLQSNGVPLAAGFATTFTPSVAACPARRTGRASAPMATCLGGPRISWRAMQGMASIE